MSQLSQTSTIPYELSQDQIFLNELSDVDELYFKDTSSPSFPIESPNIQSTELSSDHDESDTESDNEVVISEDPVISSSSSSIEPTDHDIKDSACINLFESKTCGCSRLYNKPCSTVVKFSDITDLREFCMSLESNELDLVIKSALFAHRNSNIQTSSAHGHSARVRQKPSQKFFIRGQEVCRAVFCFAHGICRDKLMKIGQSLDAHGLQPRVHGNKYRLPHNTVAFSERQEILKFLQRYAQEHSVPLPGRMPNHRDFKVLLLPSDTRQSDVHSSYLELADQLGLRKVSLSLFVKTWHELCPHIVMNKPSTDLCQKCQMWTFQLSSSGGLHETNKLELLEAYQRHVQQANQQRGDYKKQCEDSKQQLSPDCVEGADPCTLNATLHYSWDFAQQVLLPHHSQQVGPIYFKTPRKCEVFGVCCESSEKQVFYLADEGLNPGKGANTVISNVHHYLHTYGFGETNAQFHFDNCSSQNKNNAVLWYALWRVMTGLHHTIEYSLMIAGHTKFSPDMHFGIWKSRWRRVDAETVQDVVKSIKESSKNGHNVPHNVEEDPAFFFYDWKSFLGQLFKPLRKISKYHSFKVSHTDPGVVICKEFADSPEEKVNLLRKGVQVTSGVMPEIIISPGLDPERQWYLYDQIRAFIKSESAKDKICPLPKTGKPRSNKKARTS